MALTSTTTFDLIGQTQTISFFQSSTMVDQIIFSANAVTFASISGYNLSKSDCLLYGKYLNTYYLLLLTNFPIVGISQNYIWPLCVFDISETSSGVTHLTYTQTSQGNTVYTTNYVPIASQASWIARANPVTITLQEFYMTNNMMTAFTNQISLN